MSRKVTVKIERFAKSVAEWIISRRLSASGEEWEECVHALAHHGNEFLLGHGLVSSEYEQLIRVTNHLNPEAHSFSETIRILQYQTVPDWWYGLACMFIENVVPWQSRTLARDAEQSRALQRDAMRSRATARNAEQSVSTQSEAISRNAEQSASTQSASTQSASTQSDVIVRDVQQSPSTQSEATARNVEQSLSTQSEAVAQQNKNDQLIPDIREMFFQYALKQRESGRYLENRCYLCFPLSDEERIGSVITSYCDKDDIGSALASHYDIVELVKSLTID